MRATRRRSTWHVREHARRRRCWPRRARDRFAGWWFLIRDDAPDAADIDTAGETLERGGASRRRRPGGRTGRAASTARGRSTPSRRLVRRLQRARWAGYRVEEELASIGGNTAVGRTPDVTGTMTVAGDEVTAVDVEVDLTTLQSDSGPARRRHAVPGPASPTGSRRRRSR